jgi:hypothetical protein
MVDGPNPFDSSLLSLPEKFADVVPPILNRNVTMTDDGSRRARRADTTFTLGTSVGNFLWDLLGTFV